MLQSTKEAIQLHTSLQHTEKTNDHISDDACSLAISEPPLLEDDRDIDLGKVKYNISACFADSCMNSHNIRFY